MTIQLTKATYVSGVLAAAGSQHTLDAQTESYLVHIGAATWVDAAYTQGRFEDAKIEYDSNGVAVGIVGRANEVVGPVWATDDSGNVTGLVGPDGSVVVRNAGYVPVWTDFILATAPTIYYDPTAGGSNSGTIDNPYNTQAALAAAMTGNKSGTVLGIKRGTETVLTSTLLFDGIYGTTLAPVVIVPYGDTNLPPPVFSGLAELTGWEDQGGGIYARDITTEIGVLPHPAVWADGARLWKKATLADLQAAGHGYYFYESGQKTLYVKPASGANSRIDLSIVEIVLDISYADVASTGNIIVSGIEVKGSCSNSNLRIAPKGITTISAASNIVVAGVKTSMAGRDNANGTCDGLMINGPSDAARISGLIVRGVYASDCLNNAVEMNGVVGAIVEHVESHDCCGKMVEFYASVSNSTVRYCRCYDHTAVKLLNLVVGAGGYWVAGRKLTTGVSAGISTSDTTVNNSNTFHHNVVLNMVGYGVSIDAGNGHAVHHNTFVSGTTNTSSFNLFSNGMTGCDWSNNLSIVRTNLPHVWYKTGSAGLTGDGNVYIYSSGNFQCYVGGTNYTSLASWAVASGIDATARIGAYPAELNAALDDLNILKLQQLAITGIATLGYYKDIYRLPHSSPPTVGAIEQDSFV